MPNVPQLIRSTAQKTRIQQYIIEKDYALSYLLASIVAIKGLGDNLVLKGGTALRKLYFPGYRFSEDLDYSTRMLGSIEQIDSLMENAISFMANMLNEHGPFQTAIEPLLLKQTHPGEQKAYLVRVQFPEQRQPLCRLKVEITVDEPVLLPFEIRSVLHGFTEDFTAQIPVYSLREIAAEKLRALLQSKARLSERGWGASRVCRDYYDLWNLFRIPALRTPDLIPLLDQKCLVRNVSYDSPQDFISADLFEIANSEWTQQLLPFVPNAPKVSQVLSEVQSSILALWSGEIFRG